MNKLYLILLLFLSGCVLEPQKEVWNPTSLDHARSTALIALYNTDKVGNVTPVGPQVGDKCENCNGTGKVGDGRVFVDCAVCGGDGRIDEKDLLAPGDIQSEPVVESTPEPTEKEPAKAVLRNEIIMYTGPRCIWCTKWKNEVKGKLEQIGWIVVEVQETRSVGIPHFEMYINGVRKTHSGYMSVAQFTQYFNEVTGNVSKKVEVLGNRHWTYHGSIEDHLLNDHFTPIEVINSLSKEERKNLHDYLHEREKAGGSRFYP